MKKFTILLTISLFMLVSCDFTTQQAKSDSGVEKASTTVKTDVDGHTVEQTNYIERLKRDNDLGSLKHLYVISSYTGDVLEYSTVKGKITSGGKRLSPKTVNGNSGGLGGLTYNQVTIANETYITDEIPDENGTYGESANYFYWFDTQGNYHQYFPSGGTYVHISDRPLRVRKANMTFEFEGDSIR